MAERRTIGQILMGFGRITEDDVEAALEHQRTAGGYFGDALVAMGFVSQDELEWGLASQFDLPYVFPDADSIDPEAAALVSPEWALAHLTLPIMRTEDTLTVVVDSPIKTEAADALQAQTDLKVELALASPNKIREIIRQVYARNEAQEEGDRPTPASVTEVFSLALDATSSRFGISTRGHRAWAWYEDGGKVHRRPLEGRWSQELDELVDPAPSKQVGDGRRASYSGHLNRDSMVTPVDVRYLADESGVEFLFRPIQEKAILQKRFPPPSAGIISEIRMLARSGSARFVVSADPPELGREILPHLPTLILDANWRSIYVTDPESAAARESFSIELPEDDSTWGGELESLQAFGFDVVTVDLPSDPEDWIAPALEIAAVAFVLWPSDKDRRVAYVAGIRWVLTITAEGDGLAWTLDPVSG